MSEQMNHDVWQPIPDFQGLYEASKSGEIRSIARIDKRGKPWPTRTLKPFRDGKKGYVAVCLLKDGVPTRAKVHRVIASVFVPNPRSAPQVNHINGDRSDNRASNLEWCTGSENVRHAFDQLGRVSSGGHAGKIGAAHHASRAVVATNQSTGEVLAFGSSAEAARALGLASGSVPRVCSGKWKHAGGWSFRYEQ